MDVLQIIMKCEACGHCVTDPLVILSARRMIKLGLVTRFGCIACQKAGRPDSEIVEREVQNPAGIAVECDVDVSDAIEKKS